MKGKSVMFYVVLMLVVFSCGKGKNDPTSCNGESTRRDVKICIDPESNLIDLTPTVIGVPDFGALDVPEVHKEDPRQEVEKKVYTITAVVDKVKKYRDGDWKVKLTDGNDKYVNCENPNPGCEYAEGSMFYETYKTVRDWIEAHKDELEGKTVTITGVAFIDVDHKYPRNAAENELEIHPILDIHY